MQSLMTTDSRFGLSRQSARLQAGVSFTLVAPIKVGRIQEVVQVIKDRIQPLAYPQSVVEVDIPLAVTEALANGVVHGNKCDSRKTITVSVRASRRRFRCVVTDEGAGFDPDHIPDPLDATNEPPTSGRGLHLIRSLMSRVSFNARGNQIRMLLELPRNGNGAGG